VVLVFWTQVEGMGRTATEGLNEVFLLADGGMPLHEAWEKMKQPTSWGNIQRRYNERKKQAEQQPPATPFSTPTAAPNASSGGRKATVQKKGVPVAKSVRRPSRMVGEEVRRKTAWNEQYKDLHAQATRAVMVAKRMKRLGTEGNTYAAIAKKFNHRGRGGERWNALDSMV
jgi:hypothetical protein